MRTMFLSLVLILSGASASAQQLGAVLGVHQTSADSETDGVSIDGKFNFKAGLAAAFDLTDTAKFRTGLLYNQRHIESSFGGQKSEINFAYLDVPANIQFNVNDMFGFFGGLVVGINVDDEVKSPVGVVTGDADADQLIPLLDLGVNLTFDDMIGFDVYYERGLGGFADRLENYSSFGANFLYWF